MKYASMATAFCIVLLIQALADAEAALPACLFNPCSPGCSVSLLMYSSRPGTGGPPASIHIRNPCSRPRCPQYLRRNCPRGKRSADAEWLMQFFLNVFSTD